MLELVATIEMSLSLFPLTLVVTVTSASTEVVPASGVVRPLAKFGSFSSSISAELKDEIETSSVLVRVSGVIVEKLVDFAGGVPERVDCCRPGFWGDLVFP